MAIAPADHGDAALAWQASYAETPHDLWTRTNVGEVFSGVVTPLTFTIMTALGDAVFVQQPGRLKLLPRDLFREGLAPSAFRAINGRMYYNTGLIHHIFTDRFGFPSWFWMLSLGGPQDPAAGLFERQPLRPLRLLRGLPAMLAESRRQRQTIAAFRRDQAAMRTAAAAFRRQDLSGMTLPGLVSRLDTIAHAAEAPEAQLFDGSAAALNAYGMLAGLCERWLGDRAPANDLVTGLATLVTARITADLWRVAQVIAATPTARRLVMTTHPDQALGALRQEPTAAAAVAALDRFFDRFGHRAVDEFELRVPRWAEEPSFVMRTLRAYIDQPHGAGPAADLDRQRRRRHQAERDARRRLTSGMRHRLLPYRWLLFRTVLGEARRLLPMRENPKYHFLLFTAELRRTVIEIAQRLVDHGLLPTGDDIFFLTREELNALAGAAQRGGPAPGVAGLVAARRELYDRYQQWTPVEMVAGSDVPRVERAVLDAPPAPVGDSAGGGSLAGGAPDQQTGGAESSDGGVTESTVAPHILRGIAASAGVITAPARVALTPEEAAEIQAGEVLVAPFTDPGWTPLFAVAGAVVMDLGGLLSHGAIVAREYGVPAVVNTRRATTTLRTGQLITVDGDRGEVRWETPA